MTRGRTAYAQGVKRPVMAPLPEADIAPRLDRSYPWERTGMVPVEQLVEWAYGEQRVSAAGGGGLHRIEAAALGYEPTGHSVDGCFAIESRHILGADIDVSFGPSAAEFHPAAEAVSAAVEASGHAGMIKHWARVGSAPTGWREPEHWIVPAHWADETATDAAWECAGPGRLNPFCPIMVSRSPEAVAEARAEYGVWYEAMVDLCFALAARNLGFVVVPPVVPVAPWEVA